MLSHPMPRVRRLLLITVVGTAVVACGEEGISVPPPDRPAAEVFVEHCSGCHTLKQAGTQGSATNVRTREYKDGPNFNQRTETKNCVLYAIRNGGFSSGPMPQNIVTGPQATELANFVSKYSKKPTSSGGPAVKVTDCPAG
jgi:hypothetical protein